jgi:hypothetical protein
LFIPLKDRKPRRLLLTATDNNMGLGTNYAVRQNPEKQEKGRDVDFGGVLGQKWIVWPIVRLHAPFFTFPVAGLS